MSGRGAPSVPRRVTDVVFDLGGVLVDWDPRYLLRDRLGHDSAYVEWLLERVCSPGWHACVDAGRPFSAATADLRRRYPEHAAAIDAYARCWPDMFAGDFPASVRLLEGLRAAGLRVHALSNYPGEQLAFLYRRFPFMRLFDTVILSGLIGRRKPDARVFEYLVARIGTRACLFLDDRDDNVEAAIRCGIAAVRYSPPPANTGFEQAIESAGIAELLHGRLPKPRTLI